jgi:hypothetical protein
VLFFADRGGDISTDLTPAIGTVQYLPDGHLDDRLAGLAPQLTTCPRPESRSTPLFQIVSATATQIGLAPGGLKTLAISKRQDGKNFPPCGRFCRVVSKNCPAPCKYFLLLLFYLENSASRQIL